MMELADMTDLNKNEQFILNLIVILNLLWQLPLYVYTYTD